MLKTAAVLVMCFVLAVFFPHSRHCLSAHRNFSAVEECHVGSNYQKSRYFQP